MADVETEVRALVDRQACVDLIYRLARAIDRCDEALMRQLFHADAGDDHGLFRGSASDFVDWVLPLLRSMERTQHLIGNILIELDGDRAVGESYFAAHHHVPGLDGELRERIAAGRYLDRFERRGGVWKIAHRLAVYDWSADGPSTDSWNRAELAGWSFGQRAPADPSCRLFGSLRLGSRMNGPPEGAP